MIRQRILLVRWGLLLMDGALAAALFTVVSAVRLGPAWQEAWLLAGAPWWAWAAGYGALWLSMEWLFQLDQLRARWTFRGEVMDIARAVLLLAVAAFSLLFLVHAPDVSRLFLVLLFTSQMLFSIGERLLIRLALTIGRRNGLGRRHVLVIGTSPAAIRAAELLGRHPALGYQVVGFLGSPSEARPVTLGALDDMERVIGEGVVDEVLAVLQPDEIAYLEPTAFVCASVGKRLRLVLDEGLAPMLAGRVETLGGLRIMTIANGPDRLLGLLVKRCMDVALALVALIALAPVFALIALVVWLEDRGPVVFHQTRVGLHGRQFRILKFRTMVPDAEHRLGDLAELNEIEGHAFKVADDPRITRVGRFLRRTSLDELPQFWNVLVGQMSVVGPRPPLVEEISMYDLWHRRRLSMKPGITGLWQVTARQDTAFDRWVELDLRYIDRWSLLLDLRIMLLTVPAMLSGR